MLNTRLAFGSFAALGLASCVGSPVSVEGFYDQRTPETISFQQSPDLKDVEFSRGGLRVGFSHPDGFYKGSFNAFAESIDADMPEGAASFSGGGLGFRLGGRRVEGLMDKDSRWLLPYRFETNIVSTRGSTRVQPDLEYTDFFYSEALFDIGLGLDFSPVMFSAGWTVQFLRGRVDVQRLSPGGSSSRRTIDGLNHGPFASMELLYAEERPVHLELRVGGLEFQQIWVTAGVGF